MWHFTLIEETMPYSIEKKPGGLLLTFEGTLELADVEAWRTESKKYVLAYSEPFGVIVDMRKLLPLDRSVLAAFVEGQQYYAENGMSRSSVILTDRLLAMQFRRNARDSGTWARERYFDGAKDGWAKQAVDWVRYAVEPTDH